jgi:predicted nucleic acid-binding protein
VIHFDTSFVVDLLREGSIGGDGSANSLLVSLPAEEMAISVFVLCELLAGVGLARRGATAAVRENAHLVTRDRTDFLDIADLGLITY